jgi:hypothetical protein
MCGGSHSTLQVGIPGEIHAGAGWDYSNPNVISDGAVVAESIENLMQRAIATYSQQRGMTALQRMLCLRDPITRLTSYKYLDRDPVGLQQFLHGLPGT